MENKNVYSDGNIFQFKYVYIMGKCAAKFVGIIHRYKAREYLNK